MLRFFMTFMVFVAFVMVPTIVLGQPCSPVDVSVSTEPVQEWWMVLLDALMQLVSPIVIAVLGTLVSIAIRKWGKKLDTDKQETAIRLTNDFITAGITFAEEQGRKALKVGGAQTASAEKLQHAVDFVTERLERNGVMEIGRDELVKLIESRLAHERAKPDGVVASDSVVVDGGGQE